VKNNHIHKKLPPSHTFFFHSISLLQFCSTLPCHGQGKKGSKFTTIIVAVAADFIIVTSTAPPPLPAVAAMLPQLPLPQLLSLLLPLPHFVDCCLPL
jgi:hypothetical protein